MSNSFTIEGIERIAEITKIARGAYSYRDFADLTGISYGTLRRLESAEGKSIGWAILEKLARYTPYTFEQLLEIGMGESTTQPARTYSRAEDIYPLIEDLPPKEILRLICLLAAKLAEDGES